MIPGGMTDEHRKLGVVADALTTALTRTLEVEGIPLSIQVVLFVDVDGNMYLTSGPERDPAAMLALLKLAYETVATQRPVSGEPR